MRKPLIKIVIFITILFLALFRSPAGAETGKATASPVAESVKWLKYEDALKLGKEKGLPLVIFFHQDDCRKCEMLLAKGFGRPDLAAYLNLKFAPVLINIKDRSDLKTKFRVASCPLVWFLSPEAKEIDYFMGYVPPERLALILHYVGDGVYKTKSFADYEKAQKKS